MDDFTEYWCEVDNEIDVERFSLWLNESGMLFHNINNNDNKDIIMMLK